MGMGIGRRLADDMAALGMEVARLKEEVSALREEVRGGRPGATAGHKGAEDLRAAEEEKKRYRERGEALESRFRQQATDPAWASKTTAVVQDALASEKIAASAVRNVECRSGMCRVEIADNGQPPNLDLFPLKVGRELPSLLAYRTEEGGGAGTLVLYLSRDGFTLPNPGD